MVSKAKNSKPKAPDSYLHNKLGFTSAIIIAVFVPLVFAPNIAQEAFSTWKVNLAIIASVFLILAWLARWGMESRIILNRPYYFWPLLLLGVSYTISTVFSVNPMVSFFGSHGRFEGLLTYLGYLAIGLLIPTVTRRDDVERLISALIWAGVLISAYGVIQHFGIDWKWWEEGTFAGERVFSTFGNPLTLSGYIVLIFPLAFTRLLKRPQLSTIAFILLGASALLFTYSRSGWLAFAIEIPLLAVIFFRWLKLAKPGVPLKSTSIWAAVVVLVIVVLAVIYSGDIGSRIASAFDQKSDTASARLHLWGLTLDMIQKRPILGYGIDTFLQVSTRSLDLTQYSFEINKRYDRPHSDILQVTFSLGFVGLMIYLLFFSAYFLGILHFLRKQVNLDDRLLVAGLGLGVFGYLVSLQFYFSTVGVTPAMWLMVGLTASVIGSREIVLKNHVPGTLTLAALGFCLLLLIPNLMTLAADIVSRKAIDAEINGDRLFAVSNAKLASQIAPWQIDYLLQYGELLEASRDIDGAISVYKKSIGINPETYEGYFRLAQIYYRQNDYQASLNYALAALERYPLKYDARLIYALISAANGEIDVAVENLQLLTKIDPTNFRAYYYLGLLYRDLGRQDDAKLYLQKALSLSPNDPNLKQALSSFGDSRK
ncbi:MAG: O-antigen ligase family protein [Actinomycetota bacterium]|nr:O-antigen ligase family protein [Actinomycetota bacterium]